MGLFDVLFKGAPLSVTLSTRRSNAFLATPPPLVGVQHDITIPGPPSKWDDPNYKPPTIRLGSTGEAVEAWQEVLDAIPGFVPKGMIASSVYTIGTFDQRTLTYTKRWQKDHKLTPDGVVGPRTWALALKIHRSDDPNDDATYNSLAVAGDHFGNDCLDNVVSRFG